MDILRLRNAVWDELMDAERVVSYFSALSKRYIAMSYSLKGVILLFGLGNVVSLLAFITSFPPWACATAGALLAIIVVLDAILGFEKKIAAMSLCIAQFSSFRSQWKRLWREIESQYNLPTSDALDDMNEKYLALVAERQALEKWFSTYDIPENKRINEKAAQMRDIMKKGYEHV